ncbi:MAG: diacylglycerol kinase family lipid kinase [Eubacteriales bacterium]|nr:diacylglycerol kinase family lipid kinase [Eubacteriales bacterium]
MKIKALINPNAGRLGMANSLIRGLQDFQRNGLIRTLEIIQTKSEADARFEVIGSDHAGFDCLLVAGGDGTVNNVVNGIMEAGHKIPLLICAAGTVNDFGVANSLPQDMRELEELLKNHTVIPVDVGVANDRHFLNVAAGGFLSEISFITPRNMKMVLGQFAYYLTAIFNIQQIFTPYRIRIQGEDFDIEDDFLFFTFGNCESVGGFRNLVPEADVQDGKFDLLCLRGDPDYLKPNIIPLLMDVLNGEHLSHPAIFHRQSSFLRIESEREIIVDLDGEEGPKLPVNIEVKPRALNLLVPRSSIPESKLELV